MGKLVSFFSLKSYAKRISVQSEILLFENHFNRFLFSVFTIQLDTINFTFEALNILLNKFNAENDTSHCSLADESNPQYLLIEASKIPSKFILLIEH